MDGPFPADGFFGAKDYKNYDVTLAMYHDQALIPLKLLSFLKLLILPWGFQLLGQALDMEPPLISQEI